MRRSLLLRLLGFALAVASLGIVATALLATHSTGTQLRGELESSASLLETDSQIRSALLAYATEHDSWEGVEPLVRGLAEETGRRIALTTAGGEPIIDSAELLGEGSAELPSVPAARIDAAGPPESLAPVAQRNSSPRTRLSAPESTLTFASYSWQMTDQERQQRQDLADMATDCLAREGIEANIPVGGETHVLYNQLVATNDEDSSVEQSIRSCVPDELYAPSEAARALNGQVVELTTACLDEQGLAYKISADSYDMRVVQPVSGGDNGIGGSRGPSTAWVDCEETARVEATRPYVASPAELYLGTSDRFDPFSPDGLWRTAATTAVILLAAATITVLAGRRLLRPILALTAAAQRMEAGDRTARVSADGSDEVTRLAHAFNAMAESIENSDRQRKALVSDIAHELRNPLTNVRNHLEAAEDGVLPLDAALIQSLLEEATLLERLVFDLQDLALADAGMLRIHPEESDAADLARQAVAAHRAEAEASGVVISIDAPDPVPVHADPVRLRQALGNLVSNAVTHTPVGGTVEVGVQDSAGSVVLTVADTGSGIASEHLPHVFDRFYRADPSRSRATGGSGLGLAITKHLVEAHDGSIDAASTPGHGSVFTIHIPKALQPD